MEPIIKLEHVTMQFNMAGEKVDSIKEYLIKLLKRQIFFKPFIALNDVSFTVNRGEVLGIIGLNGSGKSTVLKIISGIMKPTNGTVTVNGTVSPLIELGAGFDHELTGRENIFLNGATMGYTKKFLQSVEQEIIDFSELAEFIDVPIKNYSSGMIARLAFAVATIVKPQILIVDEVLSVGDFRFQQKCEQRIGELMHGDTTVLIVSHSIEQIRRLCNRVVWLDKGVKIDEGPTEEVCSRYQSEI